MPGEGTFFTRLHVRHRLERAAAHLKVGSSRSPGTFFSIPIFFRPRMRVCPRRRCPRFRLCVWLRLCHCPVFLLVFAITYLFLLFLFLPSSSSFAFALALFHLFLSSSLRCLLCGCPSLLWQRSRARSLGRCARSLGATPNRRNADGRAPRLVSTLLRPAIGRSARASVPWLVCPRAPAQFAPPLVCPLFGRRHSLVLSSFRGRAR
jgi:hypothetical protein